MFDDLHLLRYLGGILRPAIRVKGPRRGLCELTAAFGRDRLAIRQPPRREEKTREVKQVTTTRRKAVAMQTQAKK